MHRRARRLLAALLLPGLSGCIATVDGPPGSAGPCAGADPLERSAQADDLFVSAPRKVAGFPTLGTSRVLGSFDPLVLTEPQRRVWLQRLQDAGMRRDQLLREALTRRGIDPSAGDAADCTPPGEGGPADGDDTWQALASATQVPDEYLTTRRALGLYPLTALPVRVGIAGLQRDTARTFATPLDDLPQSGVLQRFAPTAPLPAGAGPLPATAFDALGVRISRLPGARLEALFDRHAPVLEIDVAGTFDRPGAPGFGEDGKVGVDVGAARAYRYASVMPLNGELRLQLVYVFWFEARPRRGAFDTLGGRLDGIVWRVTLDDHARPLVYDAMHPCGCYHMLFPSSRLDLRADVRDRPEPPLVPQQAPRPAPEERVVLRLASGTHYLQRVYTDSAGAGAAASTPRRYTQHPYGDLYSVPSPAGARSLFGPDGIVPGTQRAERFYLWPMGVPSPGAMRERGRHATAFIGRRHFDDARLLDDLFRLRPET